MSGSGATSPAPLRSALGILLGASGAVGALVVGLALDASAWPLCTLVGALALGTLHATFRAPYRLWHGASLVGGSALGMVAGLSMALGVASQAHLQVALESTGFESSIMGALGHSQCELALSLLSSDLSLISQRPALSVPVRWEMWDQAAAHGCVSGETLSQARLRLEAHLETAPLPAGVDREALIRRMEQS